MKTLFTAILFIISFLIILKVLRFISGFLTSYKNTVNDLKQKQKRNKKAQRFEDVEEANFREIPSENKKESESN